MLIFLTAPFCEQVYKSQSFPFPSHVPKRWHGRTLGDDRVQTLLSSNALTHAGGDIPSFTPTPRMMSSPLA